MSEIFLKSERFRTFRSTDLVSDFFSDVQNFSEPQIFCQVADEVWLRSACRHSMGLW